MKKDNAIFRLQSIDSYLKRQNDYSERNHDAIMMAIEALEEQKPHGEWNYHSEWELDGECAYECSRCGMGADVDYNFCPNCGASMRKEGEKE